MLPEVLQPISPEELGKNAFFTQFRSELRLILTFTGLTQCFPEAILPSFFVPSAIPGIFRQAGQGLSRRPGCSKAAQLMQQRTGKVLAGIDCFKIKFVQGKLSNERREDQPTRYIAE